MVLRSLADLGRHAADLLPRVDCPTGKRPHYTSAGAMAQLRALAASGYATRGAMHPYLCPHCDRWHVGHLPSGRTTPCTS